MTARQTRILLVGMMVTAGPLLFALDLLARHFVLDGQDEEVRAVIGGAATQFAWLVVPAPVLGGIAGFFVYPRVYARQLASARGNDPERAAQSADLTALMFAASMPQLPALLGDFSVVLGGGLTPVICSTSLSVVAVLLIALFARRPATA
jgi:Na+/proline symporter